MKTLKFFKYEKLFNISRSLDGALPFCCEGIAKSMQAFADAL